MNLAGSNRSNEGPLSAAHRERDSSRGIDSPRVLDRGIPTPTFPRGVSVVLVGGRITLRGTVCSWLEKTQAAEAAWSSLQVTEVDNQLRVRTA